MKLFGVIVLAGLLSTIPALGVTLAEWSLFPCYSDPAGCGMSGAYLIFLVPVYALVAMIGFGIAAPGRSRGRALKLTMLTLILASVFLGLFGAASDLSKGRSSIGQSLIEVIQVFSGFWVVVVVQYFIVRAYLLRRER